MNGADLRDADLRGANLRYACVFGADFRGARWGAPAEMLGANWSWLPSHLVVECIVHDMSNHDDPHRFADWAAGYDCPYNGCEYTQSVGGMGQTIHRAVLRKYGVDRAIRRARHGGAWSARRLQKEILAWCEAQRTDSSEEACRRTTG